jgi:GLPGLI family protein
MKRLLYIILYIALAATASAQEAIDTAQFVAVYDYECRTQDAEGTPVTDRMQVVVQVGRTVTKSMPRSAYMKTNESAEEEDVIMAEHHEAVMHMPTVWTDYPLGKTTVRDWIFPHEFEGSEPTPDIAWTLTDDTLTVSGYLCQQATATHRGVEWRVWYTEEIPSSAGPWRLRGLPGMIVQAENEAHTFCLTELRQEATPITTPEKNPDVQRMAYAKLLKHRNDVYGNRQYAKNPFFHVPDLNGGILSLGGSIRHMEVFQMNGQDIVFADGHPLLTKAHVYQPLEVK